MDLLFFDTTTAYFEVEEKLDGRYLLRTTDPSLSVERRIKIDLVSLRTLGLLAECFERVRAGGGHAVADL